MTAGNINENIPLDKIREYIFFSETKTGNLVEPNEANPYLLGNAFNTAYYFYYEKNRLTTLNHETLRQIVKERADGYVIYADVCTLTDAELAGYKVNFKKIPRDIRHF